MSTILRSGLEQFALTTQWLENQRADNLLNAFWTEADPSVGGPLRPQTPTMRGKRTRWKRRGLLSLPNEVRLVSGRWYGGVLKRMSMRHKCSEPGRRGLTS